MENKIQMITKQEFKRYLVLQKSGITNMFDITKVMQISNLSREKCLEIMKNYGKYKEEYK